MNLISPGTFAFLVRVLIRMLQDLDRMSIKKCSTINYDFHATCKKSHLVHYLGDVLTHIDWALNKVDFKDIRRNQGLACCMMGVLLSRIMLTNKLARSF